MINRLRERLLVALESNGDELVSETTKAILNMLNCDMCTLWIINHHKNSISEELGNYDSASLVIRLMKGSEKYPNYNSEDFVHRLRNSFIEYVINENQHNGKSYYICGIDDEDCKKHLSTKTLKEIGLKYLICIPLLDKEKEPYAFVMLAYKEMPFDKPSYKNLDMNEMTDVVNKAISSAFSRYQMYQKQKILDDLIENYSRNKSTLKDIFYPVIHRIFKRYFDYEGASVFIWDSFDNRFNLLSTTGLEPYEGVASYEITSIPSNEKNAKIYDDLEYLGRSRCPQYLHKYLEKTLHSVKTMLVVPILRPSNPENVIGIIRFTNKTNKQSVKAGTSVVDHFNNVDIELIKNAFHYLALNVENYLAEEERKDFISKMSHEFKTPATAIRVTAERVLRSYKSNNSMFMQTQFEHYMESIIDYSTLQIMQVTTNLFLNKSGKSSISKFSIGNYPIVDIIKESINIIRPIARAYCVQFDNIRISDDFPNITLRVDKEAFIMVFYNLLSNAIKYNRYDSNEFRILFHAKDTSQGLMIYVSDNGIGIMEEDVHKIFLLGVRSENARKIVADGYGIGLYVVKLILDTFGGEISVSSCQNPTTFEIKLPRNLYI
jgi:signal transduction histidine kinase